MQDHYSAVTSLSLVSEGNLLLTAGRDKVANLWDLNTHKKLATIPVFEAIEGERFGRCPCQSSPALDALIAQKLRCCRSCYLIALKHAS